MISGKDLQIMVSQDETQNNGASHGNYKDNPQNVEESKEILKRQKSILGAAISFIFLICYLYFQYKNNNLQQQIAMLKREYLQHTARDNQEKEFQKKKFSFLREYDSQQFYSQKVEKIKDVLKQDNFLSKNENARTSFLLAMNNYKLTHQNVFLSKEIQKLLRTEYQRLSAKYDFTLPEQPFCIFVPTINNVQNFRYEYNLRSIFNQNYTNFKVVIIDDASTDQNFEAITQWLKDNPVSQEVILVKNQQRGTAVPNIYKAATQYCKPDDIMALVDGDDELLGVNVLKVFNSLYTTNKLQVLYSNFIFYKGYYSVLPGISRPYTEQQKKDNLYRTFEYTRMFPVRSFRVRNFLKIRKSDFQSQEGAWFKSAYDHAICTPLLELSCGKNEYVDEYFYLYNTGIGNNDLDVDADMNIFVANEVHYNKKRYQCEA